MEHWDKMGLIIENIDIDRVKREVPLLNRHLPAQS